MNRFAHFFIDRPIFASVLSILIVLVGGLALIKLPIAQYPEIAPPTVVINATYSGANAQVVAETVATPIEQEVNGVEDMLYMSSQSHQQRQHGPHHYLQTGDEPGQSPGVGTKPCGSGRTKAARRSQKAGYQCQEAQYPDLSLVVNLISPDKRYDSVYLSNYALLQIKDTLARLPGVGDIIIFSRRP